MTPLLSKLLKLASRLDEAALEALSSKGLLRRARKDIERGIQIQMAGETAAALKLQIGSFEVTLPASGPAQAHCSCPAQGVCQHPLIAVLFLQGLDEEEQAEEPRLNPAEPDGFESLDQELNGVSRIQLETWAGRLDFLAGLELAAQFKLEVIRDPQMRIRVPALNAEVHVVQGGGLDGMIVAGGKGENRPLVVAAVIGFQMSNGVPWLLPGASQGLPESAEAPRSRAEVIRSCRHLLQDTLVNGLCRISMSNPERWSTLAMSAHGVSLPRLALELRGIGNEVASLLSREATSDVASILSRMARTYALCTALEVGGDRPRLDLVGLHRTRYDEIGHLYLIGAAAWPWKTASGHQGLTVLFWEPSTRAWHSWTDSRPNHQSRGFAPVDRFTQFGPWEGAESPKQLASSAFRLMNARRNLDRRLSSSGKTRVLVTGPARLAAEGISSIENWSQLLPGTRTHSAIGLTEPNPLNSVIVLKPTHWGKRGYDQVDQVFRWDLGDTTHRTLGLQLKFDAFTETSIRFLETLTPDMLRDCLVIGRLHQQSNGLYVHPYSLHLANGRILHLALEEVPKPPTAPARITESSCEEPEDLLEGMEEAQLYAHSHPVLGGVLDELHDSLLRLAEAGFTPTNPPHLEGLIRLTNRLRRLGLAGLAAGLDCLVDNPTSQTVLQMTYLVLLHRRALSTTPS